MENVEFCTLAACVQQLACLVVHPEWYFM